MEVAGREEDLAVAGTLFYGDGYCPEWRESALSGSRVPGVVLPVLCRVSDTGPLMIYPPVLRAGVRKPSGKEPAGFGGRLAIYGDLMGQQPGCG
jgi:hypothetical protein